MRSSKIDSLPPANFRSIDFSASAIVPPARFGHTMTAVAKNKIVLFGGATGDTGKYSITADTYCLDLLSCHWTRLDANVVGTPPSPRAAHASTGAESMQMVVYGGATGGGSLASDDLFLLDLREGLERGSWTIVPVVGPTPGRRYGHTICYVKPHLLIFGGNTGSESVSDVWMLNVERGPFSWVKLEIKGEVPPVRVYHSAAVCMTGYAMGMMVIFGGRTADQSALNDTWGLRKHRDGRWDWVRAPYKSVSGSEPTSRYQHSTLFIGGTMFVIGGRTNQVGEKVPLEVYNTDTSEWKKFTPLQRFRHTVWSFDSDIYVHGGFDHETPNIPTGSVLVIDSARLLGAPEPPTRDPGPAKAAAGVEVARTTAVIAPKARNATPEIRLASHVVVAFGNGLDIGGPHSDELMKKVSLDRLQEEGKRIGIKALPPGISNQSLPQEGAEVAVLQELLKSENVLAAGQYQWDLSREAIIAVIDACTAILRSEHNVVRVQPPAKIFGSLCGQYLDLLRHFETWGEPSERPKLGDIESFSYVFLGGFVGRGTKSVETILLLLALKIKYPDAVYLIRGQTEDRPANQLKGLADECGVKFQEDSTTTGSIYSRLNSLFELLPLAAVVGDLILCVHGGIGQTWRTLEELDQIPRPITINKTSTDPRMKIVNDAIFSDPIDADRRSVREPNPLKYNGERAARFLTENRLAMLIRTHEPVLEGYDRIFDGKVMTVFSATDYCGKYKNAAALLVIKRTLEIIPKTLSPTQGPAGLWLESDSRNPPTPPRAKNR